MLIGNLGRDAETKFTPSGASVTRFSVATTRNWQDKASGEWKEDTNWTNVVLWRAEKLSQYLTKGKRVRVRFLSESMMFHPMHLHGHTFQVVGQDGPAARKDTVLVPPKQTVEVDFDTDNPGKWIVHCHNDYHLDGGMATFFSYSG